MREKFGLANSQLKWIALFFMTIDHMGVYLRVIPFVGKYYEVIRAVGRIAAPLFLFLTAIGLWHTRSKLRYTIRLYVAAIMMQFGNIYLGQGRVHSNIFQTLFYVVLYVYLAETMREGILKKNVMKIAISLFSFFTTLCFLPLQVFVHELQGVSVYTKDILVFFVDCFLPNPFSVEYSILFIFMGVVAYYLKEKKKICVFFCICCIASYFGMGHFLPNQYIRCYVLFSSLQYWMFLALPFLYLYNGKKGKEKKWVFYIYYPLHQYVFALAAIWLEGKL